MKLLNDKDYNTVKTELTKLGIFNKQLPKFIDSFLCGVDTKGIDVPKDIKIAMITFWLSVFATQFKIKVHYRNIVPLNSLFFVFAPSSTGKDLTYGQIKKLFQEALDIINAEIAKRYELLDKDEKSKIPLPSIEIGISTSEGMLQNIATLNLFGIGEAFIYSGEFTSEFISNPLCAPIFRDLNELVGNGIKNAKQLKDHTKQTARIEGSGLSALLATDISRICMDNNLLTKLRALFQEGLARRSNIVLIKETSKEEIEDFFEYMNTCMEKERQNVTIANKLTQKLKERTKEIISKNLMGHTYTLDRSCSELMFMYSHYLQRYVNDLEKETTPKETIKLFLLHKKDNEFRAVRLASAIAVLKGGTNLKREHLIEAIQLIEYLNEGMFSFEKELNKQIHDLLVEFCNSHNSKTINTYTASDLMRAGFINAKSQLKQSLENLCLLANQSDENSFYETDGRVIKHTKLTEKASYVLSYKELKGIPKEQRHTQISTEFYPREFESFEAIKEVLSTDCAYCSFTFKDGKRGNANIDGLSSIFVFDIDSSYISYRQFHNLIKEINHHIAKTSDDSNDFKFRVIIELDRKYNLDIKYYSQIRSFIVKTYLLNIPVDKLAISQAYYGYEGREVLSVTDKNKFNLKFIFDKLQQKKEKELTLKERNEKLNDKDLTEFAWAINRDVGERNLTLIRVLNQCKDLDASYSKAKEIMEAINNTFENKLTEEELQRTIIPHLDKHFAK